MLGPTGLRAARPSQIARQERAQGGVLLRDVLTDSRAVDPLDQEVRGAQFNIDLSFGGFRDETTFPRLSSEPFSISSSSR